MSMLNLPKKKWLDDQVKAEILECIQTLKSSDFKLPQKTKALQKLSEVASKHEESREFIISEGVLEPIKILLAPSKKKETELDTEALQEKTKAQQASARALRSFAFESDKNKQAIVKSGCLSLVVSALQSTSDDTLQIDCSACICNLTVPTNQENLNHSVKVGQSGAIETMIRLLSSPKYDVVAKTISAFWNLVFVEQNREIIEKKGGIEPILDLLTSKDGANVQGVAAGVLCLLTKQEGLQDIIEKRLKEKEKELFQQLQLEYNSYRVGRVKIHPVLVTPLVHVLDHSNKMLFKWLSARAIHFLLTCAKEISVVVSQRGVISHMMNLLKAENEICRKQAEAVLSLIAVEKDNLFKFQYLLGSSYSRDMRHALDTDKYSDVKIKLDQREIECHKVILCTRIPEIKGAIKDKDEYIVKGDIKYEALLQLLEYVYTSDIESIAGHNPLESVTKRLLESAECLKWKSIVDELKKKLDAKEDDKKDKNKMNIDEDEDDDKLVDALKSDEFSDVTFEVGGAGNTKKLKAHKIIIYSRCIYFKHMFDSGMAEAHSSTIPMPDDPETFEELMYYLYTDKLRKEVSGERLALLMFTANAYNLPRLVEMCEALIKDEISIENVCTFLPLADQHQAKQLAWLCVGCAALNYKKLKDNKEFKKQLSPKQLSDVENVFRFMEKFFNENKK